MSKGRDYIIPLLIYDMTLDKSFYFCCFIYKIGTKNTFSEGLHVKGISEPKGNEGTQGGFSGVGGIFTTQGDSSIKYLHEESRKQAFHCWRRELQTQNERHEFCCF